MKGLRYLYVGVILVALVVALGSWSPFPGQSQAPSGKGPVAPTYKVDPSWPKPLPNKWLVGQVCGIAVDKDDNIWIVQRPRTLTSDEAGATDATAICVDEEGNEFPCDWLGNPRPQGSISECCRPAPSVMQFDRDGNLLRAWGGPDPALGFVGPGRECDPTAPEADRCEWPESEHGIFVDHNMNVYIGGNSGNDGQVLKFSADGHFLMQVGRSGAHPADSNDISGGVNGTPWLWRAADMEVDPETNELYIADGYGNHRVVVVDADTGMYIRHWGGYGQRPVDDAGSDAMGGYTKGESSPEAAPPHFRNPVHCVGIAKDGLVYVCDRTNDRIQVFDKETVGTADCQNPDGEPGVCGFVDEFFVATDTLGSGSTWDLDTSNDKQETYLFNADGTNQYVWTLLRDTGDILDTFGQNGRNAGQFHWVHNMVVDSKGYLYTAEVDTGKRVQKFKMVGHHPTE